jgi:hypothetical protein
MLLKTLSNVSNHQGNQLLLFEVISLSKDIGR